jgi:carbamoyltransferase
MVNEDLRIELDEAQNSLFGIEKLNLKRSELPAITHVDYSLTGCGVLVNTSFNVRGEPIVCTPNDAYRCFMRTEMDFLVIENFVLAKADQPKWQEKDEWQDEFELD